MMLRLVRTLSPRCWRGLALTVAVTLVGGVFAYFDQPAKAEPPPAAPLVQALFQGQGQPAPMANLEGGTDWLNTSSPLKIEDLRGRVVLLDFWTLC